MSLFVADVDELGFGLDVDDGGGICDEGRIGDDKVGAIELTGLTPGGPGGRA